MFNLRKSPGVGLFIFIFLYSTIAMSTNNEQLLVDVAWLVKHKNSEDIVVVDVRPFNDYRHGHISDAVNIPVSTTFNPKVKQDRVANSAHIASLFSNAGISHEDTVVIYDSGQHIDAGRVFWVFEVFGHEKVKLLNGGYPAWTSEPANPISKTITQVAKTNYIPRLEPKRLTTKLSMQLAIDDNSRIIIDARSQEEYNGQKSIAKRFGHIPNSINIPWDNNFTNKNGIKELKSVDELKQIYSHIDSDKQVYLYCNKGKQSSLSYMVMRQLGYNAAHYDGSWYEWGNDDLLPIE